MAISDKITSIQDHLKDDWDSVESLIGDTELDKNIENISSALDDLYNDLPKVTGSGTSITLDDTRKGRLESTLSGNTSQTQYTGKNLLPPTIATETKNGITLTNNGDGSYTLTGTYSTSTTFEMALPATLNGTYSFSGNNPTAGKNIQFRILASSGSSLSTYLNNVNKTVENKTIENGTKQSIRIVGSFTSGFTFKPQLESGSTATSYEPYVGGVATPNPTNPADVNVVSGDNEILIQNANLWSSEWEQGDITNTGADSSTNNRIRTKDYIPVIPNQHYAIKRTIHTSYIQVRGYDENKNFVGAGADCVVLISGNTSANPMNTGDNCVIYPKEGISYLRFVDNSNDLSTKYMMIKGDTIPTDYVPYEIDTYNIDLPVENLLPNLATPFDTTSNGVTKKGENGTYRVYGTATGAFYGVNNALVNNYTIKGGDYLHLCNNSVVSNIAIVFYTTNSNFSYEPNAINRIIDLSSHIGETITGVGFYTSSSFNGDVTLSPMILQTNKQNSYTPYGTTPIELCKIGNYQDYFAKSDGRNLFNGEIELGSIDNTTGYKANANTNLRSINYIEVSPNTTYTIQNNKNYYIYIYEYTDDKTFISYSGQQTSDYRGIRTFTTTTTTKYIMFRTTQGNVENDLTSLWQLEKGSSATPWQPFGVGKWYLHKEIVSFNFNGTENWSGYTDVTGSSGTIAQVGYNVNYYHGIIFKNREGFSNRFQVIADYSATEHLVVAGGLKVIYIQVAKSRLSEDSLNGFKNWLSNNNTSFYGVLDTPTNTEITDTALINQLEELYIAKSKENQTNISQINNDLPFIINATALLDANTYIMQLEAELEASS